MTSSAPTTGEAPLTLRETAGIFSRHLASLYLPLNALVFLWTGPHPWYVVPLFIVPLVWIYKIDCSGRDERRQPARSVTAWPFDALVYVLAALQFVVVLETVRFFAMQSLFSLDMVMATLILVSGSSGFSIITAHELIHRTARWEQQLGRLMLCTVLYEHFYTEHLRGHHLRVGTPEDPATAHFGEGYETFFRRTVPAQFQSAWRLETARLEKNRLEKSKRSPRGPWVLQNRILQGFMVEGGIACAILASFGVSALVAFILQAFMAVRLLEAVNYFEHWGLVRRGPRVRTQDSWDTHASFTYYGLVGLSRHADHHARPARPYQSLRVVADAPLLPYGYIGMIDTVMGKNDEFQILAAEELARRRLGPFEPEDGEEARAPLDAERARECLERAHAERAENSVDRPTALGRFWRRLPLPSRRIFVFGGIILAATAGVYWETGAAEVGFLARLLLHTWIVAALFLVLALGKLTTERLGRESLGWTVALSTLLLVGMLTDRII